MTDPLTSDEFDALRRIPGAQDRQQWKTELSAVLREARSRGDRRNGNEIIQEWLKFRAQYEDGPR